MIKTRTASILLLGAAGAFAAAPVLAAPTLSDTQPAFWTGPYVGGQFGLNNSGIDSVDSSSSISYTIGPHIGYNFGMPLAGLPSPLILGANVFANFNGESNHLPNRAHFGSNVYGMDVLVGMPVGAQRRIMPYFKLGFGTLDGTGDLRGSSTNVNFGIGAEYKLMRNWGLTAQWLHESANDVTNNNFTVGVNYHFGRS